MPKTPKTRIFYLDTKTGRFASKATWKRSKQHGGTRYVRRIIKPKKRKKKPPKETEYQINVKYGGTKKFSTQVQISVTARSGLSRKQIEEIIKEKIDTGVNPTGSNVQLNLWLKFGKRYQPNDAGYWKALGAFFDSAKKEKV